VKIINTQPTYITHFMQRSPWESCSSLAGKEILLTAWNPKVPDHLHKSPPHVPILSHMCSVHIRLFLQDKLSITFSSTHSFARRRIPSGLPHQIPACISLLSSVCHMPRLFSPFWYDQPHILRCSQIMSLLILLYAPTSCYFLHFGLQTAPYYLLKHLAIQPIT
jgi:hypothetical protein